MKEKVGEYIPLYWDCGDAPYELIRGHVDLTHAKDVMRHELGWEDVPIRITHGYGRWVPVTGHVYDCRFRKAKKGPGAFAVTFVERNPLDLGSGEKGSGSDV